jgi:hypothetical protein
MKIQKNKADFFIISASRHYENQIEHSGLLLRFVLFDFHSACSMKWWRSPLCSIWFS